MPYLVIASQTIEVAHDTPVRTRVEVGERARAFDGTPRTSVRARKDEWSITTAWMTRANADTLLTALEGTPPLAASGDMLGSVNVQVADITTNHTTLITGEGVSLSFTVLVV